MKPTLVIPELPEGWFFQVSKDTMFAFYRVRLMQPRKFLWWTYNSEVDCSFVLDGYEEEYVHETMCILYDRHKDREIYQGYPDLSGNYPPKEL
jgi:hypothetical protein